jgi:hypothetical protein
MKGTPATGFEHVKTQYKIHGHSAWLQTSVACRDDGRVSRTLRTQSQIVITQVSNPPMTGHSEVDPEPD